MAFPPIESSWVDSHRSVWNENDFPHVLKSAGADAYANFLDHRAAPCRSTRLWPASRSWPGCWPSAAGFLCATPSLRWTRAVISMNASFSLNGSPVGGGDGGRRRHQQGLDRAAVPRRGRPAGAVLFWQSHCRKAEEPLGAWEGHLQGVSWPATQRLSRGPHLIYPVVQGWASFCPFVKKNASWPPYYAPMVFVCRKWWTSSDSLRSSCPPSATNERRRLQCDSAWGHLTKTNAPPPLL